MSSSPPPVWLTKLAKKVAAEMLPCETMPPMGCHYHNEGGQWEVTVFAARTEVVGGEQDGLRFSAPFVLDIGALIALFTDIRSVAWQALPEGPDDEVGAHLAIEGTYGSERVLLRVAAEAPERFDVGRYANVNEMRYVDAW